MTSPNKVQFPLRLDKADKRRWAQKAKACGVSLAAYIRMAVKEYEREHERK